MSRTDAILKRLTALYPRFMDLQLDRERRLLAELGHSPILTGDDVDGHSATTYRRTLLDRRHGSIEPVQEWDRGGEAKDVAAVKGVGHAGHLM